jgi:peptidoglycan/xylan/chitin deacetylase (PgdA/CDA1 family)
MRRILISFFILLLFMTISCGTKEETTFSPYEAVVLDLTTNDDKTERIGLEKALRIMGVSHDVTEEVDEACKYRIIYMSGLITNDRLRTSEREALYRAVEDGGVLVANTVKANTLFPLFGVSDFKESRERFKATINPSGEESFLKYLNRPKELTILLGNRNIYDSVVWSTGYEVSTARPIANFDDGSTALCYNHYGEGTTYLWGIGYTQGIIIPLIGEDYEAQSKWINSFEPTTDIFLLTTRAIFEESIDPAVYLYTIPFGQESAFVITHDNDAQMSFKNSLEFAKLEKRFGVRATYFNTTKYVPDDIDIAYYDAENIAYINQVKDMGGEIGSHSVVHSLNFGTLPQGAPKVTRLSYQPLKNPTVLGEVKVSKELLDKDIQGQNTVSYRSGHLGFPRELIAALEMCGYRYDSNFSANDIMCNFPFMAFSSRNIGSKGSKIVEIPVIFDGSMDQLRQDNLFQMVSEWLNIIKFNAENEAISCMLLHPDVTSFKLKAEEMLLEELSKQDIWIGCISDLGEFWANRNVIRFESEIVGNEIRITLDQNDEDVLSGIGFAVKSRDKVPNVILLDREGTEILTATKNRKDKLYIYKR